MWLYVQHSQIWLQSNLALKSYGPLRASDHAFKKINQLHTNVSDAEQQTD